MEVCSRRPSFRPAQRPKSASVACFIGAIFLFAGFVRALKSHEPSNSWHQLVKSIFVKLADGAYLPDGRRASNFNFRRGNFVFSKPQNPQDSAPPALSPIFALETGFPDAKAALSLTIAPSRTMKQRAIFRPLALS